jgi:uncharacterized protein (TIGR02597 family)
MQQAQHARGWNFLPKLTFVITIGLITAATGFQARAVDVFTAPVGFYQLPTVTNQDTYVSNPFTRIPEATGIVGTTASAGGGVLNILQAANTPGWSAGQWTFPATSADGSISNTYYVVLTSGTKAGSYFQITNNDASANLYLDTPVEDLTGVATGTDTFKIIPFWTLGTMYPGGSGLQVSTSTTSPNRRSQILFPSLSGVGINLPYGGQTFYFLQSATVTNWVQVGSGTANFNTQVILPDMYFIVRQSPPTATTTNLTIGAVSTWNARTPLYVQAVGSGAQDNFVAVYRPASQTLVNLGLSGTNGFLVSASTTSGARRDQILTLDNVDPGINKPAGGQTYFLTPGLGGGDSGWRLVGGGATDVGTNVIVQAAGAGILIRKYNTNVVSTVIWSNAPNY